MIFWHAIFCPVIMGSSRENSGELAEYPPFSHPKELLYREAYEPLVVHWFANLRNSLALRKLREEAPDRDVVDNLERLNSLFHDLVDDAFRPPVGHAAARAVEVVGRYRDAVIWEDQLVPGPDAGPAELTVSLRHKVKRNISLALLEALVCLESAVDYGREYLSLTGARLTETVRRSTALLASLAVLHDEREKVRMRYLTGAAEEITYPAVGIGDIVAGVFRIPAEKLRVAGGPGEERIRFRSVPQDGVSLSSPTLKCPAHRLVNADREPLNNDFWNLLIDIYKLSGRLG